MIYDRVELQAICNINMGQSPDSSSYNQENDGIPFFQGNADFGDMYPVTRMWCNKPTKIANAGDLLLSVRAPIGALNFATEECCIGRGLAAISPVNEKVNIKYIYYALKSKNQELNNKGTGSTFKAINKGSLSEVKIPNIEITEQNNCVEKLDRVGKVIKYRKTQLNELDNLIKSRFVEMFGDTVTNPLGWEEHRLDEYIEFLTSGSRGWAQYFVDNENELFITIKNVKNNRISLDDIQYIDAPNNKEAERTKVKTGDLLISITADLGRTGVVGEDIATIGAYINQHLSLVRLNKEKVNPLFISYFLETEGGKRQFESKNQNGVKAGLNFDAIKSLRILVPPMDNQEDYLDFVQQVDKLKVEVQKSLDEIQLLFDALMQQYFE